MAVREADVAAADLRDGFGAGAADDDATVAAGTEVVVGTGPAVGEAVAAGGVDAEHELRVVGTRHGMWGCFLVLLVGMLRGEGGTGSFRDEDSGEGRLAEWMKGLCAEFRTDLLFFKGLGL